MLKIFLLDNKNNAYDGENPNKIIGQWKSINVGNKKAVMIRDIFGRHWSAFNQEWLPPRDQSAYGIFRLPANQK